MLNELGNFAPVTIAQIRQRFESYAVRTLDDSEQLAHAAVAIVLREDRADGEVELLMIRRAEHPRDPWSGHMGFPGGRVEEADATPECSAVRETEEELGLALDRCARPVAQLSERRARSAFKPLPMSIFPFVYEMVREVPLQLNDEVVEAVWIPLSLFSMAENRIEMTHALSHGRTVPCCLYGGRIIWGLSLAMLDELVSVAVR